MPILIDPVSYEVWESWGAGQRDLYFLDSGGNYINDFNITSWNYNQIYNQILEILPPDNTPPNAYDSSYTLDEDNQISIYLSATDTDGDALTFNLVNQPSNGAVMLEGVSATYMPNANYNGTDTFTFIANDGEFNSNQATITLTVNAINDAPYLISISNADIESSSIFIYELQAVDVDGDDLTYTVSTNGNATATISNNILTITPVSQADEIITVIITVSDGLSTDTTDFILTIYSSCDFPFMEISGQCLHTDDVGVLQSFIDNSYASDIDLDCEDNSGWYCGSPNPQMDSPEDGWFWNVIDGQQYSFADGDGIVEPLELGIQEWVDGRLVSLMCGAYIYCELSGPIPTQINELAEIEQLRLEYNHLSGFIPESICELTTNHSDYLAFDVTGNRLCPPYPECINTFDFWNQNTDGCYEMGDLNQDTAINVIDVVILVSIILNTEEYNNQADFNTDGLVNVVDAVILVSIILSD